MSSEIRDDEDRPAYGPDMSEKAHDALRVLRGIDPDARQAGVISVKQIARECVTIGFDPQNVLEGIEELAVRNILDLNTEKTIVSQTKDGFAEYW